jgi:hypothetical protein
VGGLECFICNPACRDGVFLFLDMAVGYLEDMARQVFKIQYSISIATTVWPIGAGF